MCICIYLHPHIDSDDDDVKELMDTNEVAVGDMWDAKEGGVDKGDDSDDFGPMPAPKEQVRTCASRHEYVYACTMTCNQTSKRIYKHVLTRGQGDI